jgi:hypothetical protein
MLRTTLALSLTLLTVGLAAQARPDFSGRWTRVADATDPAGGRGRGRGMGGWSDDVTVKQDTTTLTVTQTQGDGTTRVYTYKLDGTESKNQFPGRQGGPPLEVLSRVTWEGQTLVINSTLGFDMGGTAMSITLKQAVSLDGKGLLTIDTTAGGMPGGQAMTTKAQYKKG